MSASWSVHALDDPVRDWLVSVGVAGVPAVDARVPTLSDLQFALSAMPEVHVEWSGGLYPDALLSTSSGMRTHILGRCGSSGQHYEFGFRGGDEELIVQVLASLAGLVGPLVLVEHGDGEPQLIRPAPK